MAQTIEYWQNKMLVQIVAEPVLNEMSQNTSMVSVVRLITRVVATCIFLFELILDIFKTEVEKTVTNSTPATPQWIIDRVFKFQYSTTIPQVVQLINWAPAYGVIDPSLRIVTRCSVVTLPNNRVLVKAAKNEPPQTLDNTEKASLTTYLTTIGVAGINYVVHSKNPDRLFITANIYYKGEYASVIKTTVVAAINSYLAERNKIDFNGYIRLSAVIDAIQAVPGVKDVLLFDVAVRPSSVVFASKTYMVLGQNTLFYKYQAFAGYIIGEDEPGETFSDKLIFIPSNPKSKDE